MPALSKEQIEFRAYLRRELPMTLVRIARERRSPGEHTEPDGGIVLQPRDLGTLHPVTRRMPEQERDFLATGLYWMISIDEAMWTYHQPAYPRFRAVTRFPKLLGDCPGGCGTHLHPTAALQLVGGQSADWVHTRLVRSAMLAWYAPAVQDILERLARQHDLPMLTSLLDRDFAELGLPGNPGESRGIPAVDPLPSDQEITWQVPPLSRDVAETFRALGVGGRRRAHPAGQPNAV